MNRLNKIFLVIIFILVVIIGLMLYQLINRQIVIERNLDEMMHLKNENSKLFDELSEYKHLYDYNDD